MNASEAVIKASETYQAAAQAARDANREYREYRLLSTNTIAALNAKRCVANRVAGDAQEALIVAVGGISSSEWQTFY